MRLKQYINKNSQKLHEHLYNINEIFDKDIKLEKSTWDGTYFTVKFNINNKIYTFKAMENDPNEFAILFYTFGEENMGLFDVKGNKDYVGDVFSAIKKSLHLLIKERQVNMFYFNTSEPKLIKLYDGILKRMIKEFKDFEFDKSIIVKGIKFWRYKRK